ncbi:MAG: quinone oxidoreductase [Alphaproteobacteria bacterium]
MRLRHTAIGLNFIDTYYRTGLYTTKLPAIPGIEAAGMVDKVGDGVRGLVRGDRVAYARGPLGAYAEARNIRAVECVKLPDSVNDDLAAAAMLKGLTAWYLLHQTFPVNKGDTILVHAAAGGVGLLLCQWAKRIGARVIGTVGSEKKATLARQNGCDEIVFYRHESIGERVAQITKGQGVEVVYDAVGATTFTASLDSLKPLGMMVSYGQASGPIPPFSLTELARRGSLFITRPSLMDYVRDNATYHKAADVLFRMLGSGELNISIGQRFPLAYAAQAHKALEGRETVGASILVP